MGSDTLKVLIQLWTLIGEPCGKELAPIMCHPVARRLWDCRCAGARLRPLRGLRGPPVGVLAAAVVWRLNRLRRAVGAGRRAADAHMEMIVVPDHRADLVQPRAVAFDVAAQRPLDRGVGKDALDLRVLRGRLVKRDVFLRPDIGPDVGPFVVDDVVADISSRSWRVSSRSGIGVSQMSASSPT